MQIRHVAPPRKLADLAPVEIIELEQDLRARDVLFRMSSFDSDLNQVLETSFGSLQIKVVADRGQWFVMLASADSGGEYTTAVWRVAAEGGIVRDEDGSTFSKADLAWLRAVLADGGAAPVDAKRLKSLQQGYAA